MAIEPITPATNKNSFATTELDYLFDHEEQTGALEQLYRKTSSEVNKLINENTVDIEKDRVFSMILQVIQMMMRMGKKHDDNSRFEYTVELKEITNNKVATYNNWQSRAITYVSAAISVASSFAVFAPFTGINAELAKAIQGGAQTFGNAGTGISSIAGIFEKTSEGKRTALEGASRVIEAKKDGCTEAGRHKADLQRSAHAALDEHNRAQHEATKAN